MSYKNALQVLSYFLEIYLNILPSTPRSYNFLFPSGFPTKASPVPCECHLPWPLYSSWFCHSNDIGWEEENMMLLNMQSLILHCALRLLCYKDPGLYVEVPWMNYGWRQTELPVSVWVHLLSKALASYDLQYFHISLKRMPRKCLETSRSHIHVYSF
jgi:hypothetical protein